MPISVELTTHRLCQTYWVTRMRENRFSKLDESVYGCLLSECISVQSAKQGQDMSFGEALAKVGQEMGGGRAKRHEQQRQRRVRSV